MKCALFMMGSLLLAATAAQAHTQLQSSVPADKSTVAPPTVIELHFSGAARVTALTLQRGGATAKSLGPLPTKAASHISVPVTGLTAGSYTASWRVAGEDGHVMSGKFQFSVDPAAPVVSSKAKAGKQVPAPDRQGSSGGGKKPAAAGTESHQH